MDDSTLLKHHLFLNPNPTLPILVLGAPNSGKRSLCNRLAHNIFPLERDPTEDGHYRRLISLFPPDGQGRDFRVMLEITTILTDAGKMIASVLQHLVRACEACVLVYRTSERGSFDAVPGLWREWISGRMGGRVVVVANCGDGVDDMVGEREGREMAEGLGAGFWQMSAKTGRGAGEEEVVGVVGEMMMYNMRQGGFVE